MRKRIKEGEARIKAKRLKKPIKEKMGPKPQGMEETIRDEGVKAREELKKEEAARTRIKEAQDYPNISDVDLEEKEEETEEEGDSEEEDSRYGGLDTYDDSSSFNFGGMIIGGVTLIIVISVGIMVIGSVEEAMGESTQNISGDTLTGLFSQIAPFGSSVLFPLLLLFPIILVFMVFNRMR